VLRIAVAGKAVLLAGDIEAAQEAELLDRNAAQPGALHADVLLAPHHGSGTSSTPAFLDAVSPAVALFQVGYRNRYHHPKQEVWERYGQHGILRLRSDQAGAITVEIGPTVATHEYRREHPRYWYGR
jgi:competence protein ComEC